MDEQLPSVKLKLLKTGLSRNAFWLFHQILTYLTVTLIAKNLFPSQNFIIFTLTTKFLFFSNSMKLFSLLVALIVYHRRVAHCERRYLFEHWQQDRVVVREQRRRHAAPLFLLIDGLRISIQTHTRAHMHTRVLFLQWHWFWQGSCHPSRRDLLTGRYLSAVATAQCHYLVLQWSARLHIN